MLQNVLTSRKAADAMAEFLTFALVAAFFVKFPVVLLVPFALVLVAIPFTLVVWLPASREGFGFVAIVVTVAALMELWAYFIFQLVHKAHFGYPFPLSLA